MGLIEVRASVQRLLPSLLGPERPGISTPVQRCWQSVRNELADEWHGAACLASCARVVSVVAAVVVAVLLLLLMLVLMLVQVLLLLAVLPALLATGWQVVVLSKTINCSGEPAQAMMRSHCGTERTETQGPMGGG